MNLYATLKSNTPNFTVEFIEVLLKNGKLITLDWDESGIQYTEDGYNARYKGVYFDEEYANGRISELDDCKVINMEVYSESRDMVVVHLCDMFFTDDDKELDIKPQNKPYLFSAVLPRKADTDMYDAILIEKQIDDGLLPREIVGIAKRFDEHEKLLPVEFKCEVSQSVAMGFITYEAADSISFDFETLGDYITSILEDMDNESIDGIYTYDGMKICMRRG